MRKFLKKFNLLKIDDYKYDSPLKGGQMSCAAIYKNDLGKKRVVKFLISPRNKYELKLFKQEAKTLLRLSTSAFSEYMVKGISDIKQLENFEIYYFSMEYFEAYTLNKIINKKNAPLNEETAIEYLYRIAVALSPAHINGVIHRDLHAGNILFLKDFVWKLKEDDPGIRIVDYGLAKDWWKDFFENSWSEDNFRQIGALSTWSPESINKPSEVDINHDIWGLGSLFFKMLTNEWAFYAENFGEYYRLVTSGSFNQNILNKNDTITLFSKKLLKRMFETDPKKRINIGDIKKMCHDYLSGVFSLLDNDNLMFYLQNDGDVWVCPHCTEIVNPFGSRCSNCGRHVEEFLSLKHIL